VSLLDDLKKAAVATYHGVNPLDNGQGWTAARPVAPPSPIIPAIQNARYGVLANNPQAQRQFVQSTQPTQFNLLGALASSAKAAPKQVFYDDILKPVGTGFYNTAQLPGRALQVGQDVVTQNGRAGQDYRKLADTYHQSLVGGMVDPLLKAAGAVSQTMPGMAGYRKGTEAKIQEATNQADRVFNDYTRKIQAGIQAGQIDPQKGAQAIQQLNAARQAPLHTQAALTNDAIQRAGFQPGDSGFTMGRKFGSNALQTVGNILTLGAGAPAEQAAQTTAKSTLGKILGTDLMQPIYNFGDRTALGRLLNGAQESAQFMAAANTIGALGADKVNLGDVLTAPVKGYAQGAVVGAAMHPITAAQAAGEIGAKGAEQAGNAGKAVVRSTKDLFVDQPKMTWADRNTLRDYGDYLTKSYKPDGAVLNELIAQARSIGKNSGIDVTSGTPRDIVDRIYKELDRQRRLDKSQVGFIGGPSAMEYLDAHRNGRVFEGPDGKPRFEVSDEGMQLKQDAYNGKVGKLGDIIDHPELFKQYPDLKDVKTRVYIDKNYPDGQRGSYDHKTGEITVHARNMYEAESTLLHEIQHAIQGKEGFVQGGSIDQIRLNKEYQADMEKYVATQKAKGIIKPDWELRADFDTAERALGQYKRLAGEAEARAVAKRMNMTDAERYVAELERSNNADGIAGNSGNTERGVDTVGRPDNEGIATNRRTAANGNKKADQLEALKAEARQYKTVEEFVRAKAGNDIYAADNSQSFGTNIPDSTRIRNSGKPYDYSKPDPFFGRYHPETKGDMVKVYRVTDKPTLLPGDNVTIFNPLRLDPRQYEAMGIPPLGNGRKVVEQWIPKNDMYAVEGGTQQYAPNGIKSLQELYGQAHASSPTLSGPEAAAAKREITELDRKIKAFGNEDSPAKQTLIDRRDRRMAEISGSSPAILSEHKALLDEAKKYKSADEFVNSMGQGQGGVGSGVEYTPHKRTMLEPHQISLADILGKDGQIDVYRGVDRANQKNIVPGDYVGTSRDIAAAYTGDGSVIRKKANLSHIYVDKTDGFTPQDVQKLLQGGELHAEANYIPNPVTEAQLRDIYAQAHPALRSTFYDSLDVPKDQLIIRKGDGKAMSIDEKGEFTKLFGRKPTEQQIYGDNFIKSTYEGKPVTTNAYIAEFTDLPDNPRFGQTLKTTKPDMGPILDRVKDSNIKLRPEAYLPKDTTAAVAETPGSLVLSDGKGFTTEIQGKFVNYFQKKYGGNIDLYSNGDKFAPLVVKSDGKWVGVIMPLRSGYDISSKSYTKFASETPKTSEVSPADAAIKANLEQGVGSNRPEYVRQIEKNQANLTEADRLKAAKGDTGQAGLLMNSDAKAAMLEKFRKQAKASSSENTTTLYRATKTPYDPRSIDENGLSLTDSKKIANRKFMSDQRNVEALQVSKDAKIMPFSDIPKDLYVQDKNGGFNPSLEGQKTDTSRLNEYGNYQKIVAYAKAKGYDGVNLKPFGEREIRVWNPDVIKQPTASDSLPKAAQDVSSLESQVMRLKDSPPDEIRALQGMATDHQWTDKQYADFLKAYLKDRQSGSKPIQTFNTTSQPKLSPLEEQLGHKIETTPYNGPNLNEDAFSPQTKAKAQLPPETTAPKGFKDVDNIRRAQIDEAAREAHIRNISREGDGPSDYGTPPKGFDKANRDGFMQLTNKYLGAEKVGKISAVELARDFNNKFGNLTPEQKTDVILVADGMKTSTDKAVNDAVAHLKGVYDEAYNHFTKDRGIQMGYQHEYSPRIYKTDDGKTVNAAEYKILQTGSGRTKSRTAETVDVNRLVSKDPADLLQRYYTSLERAAAGRKYLGELNQQGYLTKSSDPVPGLRPIVAEGLQPGDGTVYYGQKDIATKLNNLFGDRKPSGTFEKVLDGAAKGNSFSQTLVLSGGAPFTGANAFGFAQMLKETMGGHPENGGKSFYHSMAPKATYEFFASRTDLMKKMYTNGVDPRYDLKPQFEGFFKQIANAEGAKAKISKAFHGAVDEPTFGRMMPVLTTLHYEGVYKGLLKKGVPEAEAAARAGAETRDWFGMNEPATEATRSQVAQNAVGAVFFAPRFRESMVNFWMKNAKAFDPRGNFENARSGKYNSNIKFMVAAAALYAAMDGVNYALNGQHMYQNPKGKKDKLLIPYGDQTIGLPYLSSIATVPRNLASGLYSAATGNLDQAGKDAISFLSMPLQTAGRLAFNENYFGQPIVNKKDPAPQRVGQATSYAVQNTALQPWLKQGLNVAGTKLPQGVQDFFGVKKQSGLQTASQAVEAPLRFYNNNNGAGSGTTSSTSTGSGSGGTADAKDKYAGFTSKDAQALLKVPANKRAQYVKDNPQYADIYNQMKAADKAFSKPLDLPDGISSSAANTLNQFNRMTTDAQKKYLSNHKDAEYQLEIAKFERDKLKGNLSTADEIRRQAVVGKAQVGSQFDKDIRDIYGLSKEQIYNFVANNPNGKAIADQLVQYGDALEKAGVGTNKLRNSKGTVSIKPKEKGTGSSGSKKTLSLGDTISAVGSLSKKVSSSKVTAKRTLSSNIKGRSLQAFKKPTMAKISTRRTA
jgi:hypothetical protein